MPGGTVDGPSKKLKIAFVLDWFVPAKGGESYFTWLARELCSRGHEVHVYAMAAEKAPDAPYRTHIVPVWKFPRSARILTFLRNSSKLIRENDFDIVHGVGWTLMMNVFNPHGGVEQAYLEQEFRSISNRLYYLVKYIGRHLSLSHYLTLWIQKKQYLSPRVKKIVAISEMVKRDILRFYEELKDKVVVVFNTVDLNRFHPDNRERYRRTRRMAFGIEEETILLLFAGNNYRLKGLEPLLATLGLLRKRFPNLSLRLLVVGRGDRKRYMRKARRYGVSDAVIFSGPVKEIEQYYAACDIYVHPTFYDSCSLTVLEALASGVPVVTTRHNGASEAILSDEGGIVVDDPRDCEALAEAISHFFDRGRLERAREVTRKWMEEREPRRNVEGILSVYYQVVGAV